MSLKIISVANGPDPDKEIVWLQTSTGMKLGGYAIVDKTFDSNGNASNKFRHIFIFPDVQIGEKDYVRLISGKGEYKKLNNNVNTITHCFYWNSNECVWNDGGDTARLIKFSVENTLKVPPVDKK